MGTSGSDGWVTVRGLKLHVRRWEGEGRAFVLLHGLASNCLTWEAVARQLNAAGNLVVSVDQRGHGLSDKPSSGYGFDDMTADLRELIDRLDIPALPILSGQSWGGNVVLDFAARYPGVAGGLVLVDGGFLELSARPEMTWDRAAVELRPPDLSGIPRDRIVEHMRQSHPAWSDEGIEATMGNFELLPDGTVKPHLSLGLHMQILRALWEHHPSELYGWVTDPVLIAPAEGGDPERMEVKRAAVRAAEAGLRKLRVHWFPATDHDIHVQRPKALAGLMLEGVREGFFRGGSQQ